MHALRSEIARQRFGADALRPRCADVLPVTISAPSPAFTIAGAVSRARWSRKLLA